MSKKKESGIEADIEAYFKRNNRPYSVSKNLVKQTTLQQLSRKTMGKLYVLNYQAIQKAIENLASANKLMEKTYGKQKAYAPFQVNQNYDEDSTTVTSEELEQMDSEIEDLKQKLGDLKVKLKNLNNGRKFDHRNEQNQ
ncbi:hypothetical protein RF11_15384 [Thelohanellus kitauei]|uniref:Homologous-pairing protein 2 winged helix domain-containing protein n=1 Tax=Thelohanellus kitauei TaxID=669202 RepID=A0A0C2MEU5_THEKT|nr:hypothetical protein RF11_15384 [Thelohanellus kitauei]